MRSAIRAFARWGPGAAAGAFAALLLVYSQEALRSALVGLSIWWDILFPALLPFLVMSELMLGLGLVHFFGSLLDPLMRPLFRVPGIGGFVMAVGFASGYPVSARLAARLRGERLLSRDEGERLVAFTTTSDPIFMIGAVSVGFFHRPGIAPLLVASHYGAAILVGLLMARLSRPADRTPPAPARERSSFIGKAFQAMHAARLNDNRPFPQLLLDSISASLRLIVVIGGLVVFFSVLMAVLRSSGALGLITAPLVGALELAGVPAELIAASVSGLFEVTLGTQAAGSAVPVSGLPHAVAMAAAVLSWAGLSVHAQILSLISGTGMRYGPFLLARLLHTLLSAGLVYALWVPFAPSMSAWLPFGTSPEPQSAGLPHAWAALPAIAAALAAGGAALLTASFAVLLARRASGIVRGLFFQYDESNNPGWRPPR
ncbi:nucleoside recognition domain-containing protein [Paenibacillus thermoaerophilus]|uniref:Nucleoside recognition domain-containing protein n=1 Tax=Paenibacillus thermoaerophilus TaxID=1215385 RepID=A0ABW2V1H4_9BACL|nr:nucleoside recognition domain-containing protein [Paenibacillus thermoaerophilus]